MRLKRLILLLACLALALPARAAPPRAPELDEALTWLETNNAFLRQYNRLTGAGLEAVFAAGTPYLFGGRWTRAMVSRRPDYARRTAYEDTDFFVKGKTYLYGFDCSGYIKRIHSKTGKRDLPNLGAILRSGRGNRHNIVFSEDEPDLSTLHSRLQVGDLFVVRTRYNHVMMYIGTLREWELGLDDPWLAPYLDYPLCIHCGLSPAYGRRMTNWMRKHRGDPYYRGVLTTDGGVNVSILGVPALAAHHHRTVQNTFYSYFLVDSTVVTIYSLDGRDWVVNRP